MNEYLLNEEDKIYFDLELLEHLRNLGVDVDGVVLERIDYGPTVDNLNIQGMGRRVTFPKHDGVPHEWKGILTEEDSISEVAFFAAQKLSEEVLT